MWHTLVGIKTCHTAAFLPCVSLISVLTLLPGRRSQTAAGVWQTFHFNDVISTCHKTPRLPLISCISIFYFYIYIYILPATPFQAGSTSPHEGLQLCLKIKALQGSWQVSDTEAAGIQMKTQERRRLEEPAWALTSVQHREVTINHYNVAQIVSYS